MNNDIAEGKWKQIIGKAKTAWGELTDDELDEGRRPRRQARRADSGALRQDA